MSAAKGKIGMAFMTTSGRQWILNWVSDLAVSSSGKASYGRLQRRRDLKEPHLRSRESPHTGFGA